jgi:hypothetical protein
MIIGKAIQAETFAVRRHNASTFGPRQTQDTNAAFGRHENACSAGFTKEEKVDSW